MKIHEVNGDKIIHGNAIDVLENYIVNESIDLIFVDPPYNNWKEF